VRTQFLLILGAAALTGCLPSAPASPVPAPVVSPGPSTAPATREAVLQGEPRGEARRRSTGREGGAVDPAMGTTVSATEVSQRATDVFGAPGADADARDADAEGEEGPTWDIAVAPYETHARVEHYVRHFSGPARQRVVDRLGRGTRYEPMIRQKLRAGGVPEDMYYLAFVESGFDTHAYSRAAAVGMWQFMASTARGMGLRVDPWVDERRDPVRATDAAVRFLRSLNDQFGSLYLAAAAYNGGPGRVARGLDRFADDLQGSEGEDRFFGLAEQDFLPKETKDYVPQIIAAALVGKDPARYGLSIATREPFAYDSVTVAPLTSLPVVARAAGVAMEAVRDLNPHFLRGVTPPDRASQVRLPAGSRARFDTAFATLGKAERSGVQRAEVAKAGTVEAVAERLGTTVRGLTLFNPELRRTKKGRVVAGQTVLVPDADVVQATANVPDPSIERYGSASSKTKEKAAPRFHVVKQGETLSHVSARYHTTVKTVMRLNRLRKPVIFPGQELVVASAPPAKGEARQGSTRQPPVTTVARKATLTVKGTASTKAADATVSKATATKAKGAKAKTGPTKAKGAKGKQSTATGGTRTPATKKGATSTKSK